MVCRRVARVPLILYGGLGSRIPKVCAFRSFMSRCELQSLVRLLVYGADMINTHSNSGYCINIINRMGTLHVVIKEVASSSPNLGLWLW